MVELDAREIDSIVGTVGGLILGGLSVNAFVSGCVPDYYGMVFGFFAAVFIVAGLARFHSPKLLDKIR